jgi:hypothetical protein
MSVNWLAEILDQQHLSPEAEGYLLGRAVKPDTIRNMGITSWAPTKEAIPDASFAGRYGAHAEKLTGFLAVPLHSPRGQLIGVEYRALDRKQVGRHLLPEAGCNPVFVGLKAAMPRIWAGKDVWVCEGIFDLSALEWAVPEGDAVLATIRAKMTDKHVEFFRRFCTGWVHMVYDRDETGRRGVTGWKDSAGKRHWGALDMLRHNGIKCRDVPYNGGKDPGEIWDRQGVAGLKQCFGT